MRYILRIPKLILLIFVWLSQERVMREYSLYQPHHMLFTSTGGWSMMGSVVVAEDKTILTSDTKSQSGSIWLTTPIPIRNWKIDLHFKIHGEGTSLFGDGFAFWYIKDLLKPGPVFGNHDKFNGLGIIFDTYANKHDKNSHPYVSAQLNDGTLHYDHSVDGELTSFDGCSYNFRGGEQFASILYFGSNNTLIVRFTDISTNKETECFTSNDVRLPTYYYIGLSSATGDLSDNHDIYSLNFWNLDDIFHTKYAAADFSNIKPNIKASHPIHHSSDESASKSWGTFKKLLMFVLALIVCAGCVVAILFYLEKREKARRKRFY